MNDDPIFVALLREGALAAEMLGSGVTLLRKANAADVGLLTASFFSLSIGMERAAKIAVVLDYYLDNNQVFPSDDFLRKNYGHDVGRLFSAAVEINGRRSPPDQRPRLPDDPIHSAIIRTLSDFGKQTRYHNLDLLVKGRAAPLRSPEVAWFEDVGNLVLGKHYKPEKRARDSAEARGLERLFAGVANVATLGPNSKYLRSVGEAMHHSQRAELIQRHAQFYTLQIIRYLTETLMLLQGEAHRQRVEAVPYFSELFAYFYNDDAYFRRRKTWTPSR